MGTAQTMFTRPALHATPILTSPTRVAMASSSSHPRNSRMGVARSRPGLHKAT